MNGRADGDTSKEPDPHKLRKMYEVEENGLFFDWAASRKNDASVTNVSRLIQVTHMRRTEVVALCKELAEIGCGTFFVGRRGAESRMVWDHSLKSIGMVAKGEQGRIEVRGEQFRAKPVDHLSSEAVDSEEVIEGGIDHHFPLRPGLILKIRLPEDLTNAEANRLTAWIKTLVFPD